MLKSLMMLPLLIALAASAQQPSKPESYSSQVSKYAGQREALLAPGNEAMKKRDYAGALKDYREVVAEYPRDSRVLLIAGNAAWAAGNLEEAADYYRKSLKCPGDHPWGSRLSLLQVNAALGKWDDFAQERIAIEGAATGGDPQLQGVLKNGFLLERLAVGSQHVEAIDYPEPDHADGVRYRFRLGGQPISASIFVPHIDLVEPPGKAQEFVLEQYSGPQEQTLIRSYAGGEPAYQDIRAEVLRLLEGQLGTTMIRHLSPFAPL